MKRSSHFNLPLTLIALLLLAHILFYFSALGTDAVDDAYISFRYAQNAIRGHGLVFNPGERVEGFTNFLWTALMLPLEGVRVDVGRASMAAGTLFALAVLWLTVKFTRNVGAPRGAGTLAALLLAVDGSFALWSVSGLETAMFTFLVFAGATLYVREQDKITLPFSGIFFALAAMTRPEGLLVFTITVAHQAAWRVGAERRLFTQRDLGRIVAFAVLFTPYWLGRWWYYKSFLPNSFYAKVSPLGPPAQLERGWNHLTQFVNVHLGWVIVLPPLVAVVASVRMSLRAFFAKQSHDREVGIASPHPSASLKTLHAVTLAENRGFWTTYFAAIVVPYVAYIVYVGGDWSVGRFFVPLLALFYLLFSTGLVDAYVWAVNKWASRGHEASWLTPCNMGIAASIAFAALWFLFSSWNGEYGIFIRGFDAARATAARETMGKWLRANVPRGTLIAVDAAGQVPYFSELPAIDMFGITDLHIGRLQVAPSGQGTPGHEKFDLGYVIGRAPTYVIIYGTVLDGVEEYERALVEWTSADTLKEFLTVYRRRTQ
jgi:hypothetical protein